MIRVTALYPNQPHATFDHDYYDGAHRRLVEQRLAPLGLVRIELDRGLASEKSPSAPFMAMEHLYFETEEAYRSAMSTHGSELLADVGNFTNSKPMIQISKIIG